MATFKDMIGQEWAVTLTVGEIRRVKRSPLTLDLFRLFDDNFRPFGELTADPSRLCDLLFVLVEPQAVEHGVTDEQFGARMGGDALFAGANALLEALVDFFPNPTTREALRRSVASERETTTRVIAKLVERAEATDKDAEAAEIADRILDRFQAGRSSETAGSAPAS